MARCLRPNYCIELITRLGIAWRFGASLEGWPEFPAAVVVVAIWLCQFGCSLCCHQIVRFQLVDVCIYLGVLTWRRDDRRLGGVVGRVTVKTGPPYTCTVHVRMSGVDCCLRRNLVSGRTRVIHGADSKQWRRGVARVFPREFWCKLRVILEL